MRSRQLLCAVLVGCFGALLGREVASADEGGRTVSFVVNASGSSGSIERVSRPAQPQDQMLEREVDGGVIPRGALQAELAQGVGRFLQQVRVRAVVSRGRFVAWRLMTLFPKRTDLDVAVIKPGDLVTRVNGESIERPEDFKAVWDSLATATELVVEIERGGEPTTVRYAIR